VLTKILRVCGLMMMTFPPAVDGPDDALHKDALRGDTTAAVAELIAATPAEDIRSAGGTPEIPPEVLRELDEIRQSIGNSPLEGSFLDLNERAAPAPLPSAPEPSTPEPFNKLPAPYQNHAVRSLARRLDAIAADLDELGLASDAQQIRRRRDVLQHRVSSSDE